MPKVLGEYEREKEGFLRKVFADRKYLEEVTALTLYHSVDDKIEVCNYLLFLRNCYYGFALYYLGWGWRDYVKTTKNNKLGLWHVVVVFLLPARRYSAVLAFTFLWVKSSEAFGLQVEKPNRRDLVFIWTIILNFVYVEKNEKITLKLLFVSFYRPTAYKAKHCLHAGNNTRTYVNCVLLHISFQNQAIQMSSINKEMIRWTIFCSLRDFMWCITPPSESRYAHTHMKMYRML